VNLRMRHIALFVLACAISSTALANNGPSRAALEKAKADVSGWYKEMIDQEKFLEQAYERKDIATLETESVRRMAKGMPGGDTLWRQDAYGPYLKCDTAYLDLGLLAGAMHHAAARPSDTLTRILDQERQDYANSKATCERRLKMSPQDAWREYDAR